MPLNRVMPKLPQRFMQTYRLLAPVKTHFRQVRCEDVACPNQAKGFKIIVDPETDFGKRQLHLIKESGRRYLITRRPDGMLDANFPAGQQCFYRHRLTNDREPFAQIQRGDWRTPRAMREPRRMPAAEWLDRFGTHQNQLAARVARG